MTRKKVVLLFILSLAATVWSLTRFGIMIRDILEGRDIWWFDVSIYALAAVAWGVFFVCQVLILRNATQRRPEEEADKPDEKKQ
jgi:uncharacterized membrane protein YeiH